MLSCSTPGADDIQARYYSGRRNHMSGHACADLKLKVVYVAKISGRHRFRRDFHPDEGVPTSFAAAIWSSAHDPLVVVEALPWNTSQLRQRKSF